MLFYPNILDEEYIIDLLIETFLLELAILKKLKNIKDLKKF